MFRLLILLVGIFFTGVAAIAQQKRALLIGIGSYPKENGWKSLSSENDIQYLKSILPLKGFSEAHISVLLNEQATVNGIEQAVEKLIIATGPGDIVILHYSGHGQQITDDDGDEADGYDEAWVPYDAASRFSHTGYKGEKHIRDDKVGVWVKRLSEKVGASGSIFVNIDACHSGTATRSAALGIVRGDPTPFKIPGKKNIVTSSRTTNVVSEMLSSEAIAKGNVVVFSASSPTQVNYETFDANTQGVGSLTYAFSKAMTEIPEGASYSELFYRVKAKIQAWIPQQLPMMEGDGNQKLFAGQYTAGSSNVYIDRWASDTTFTVKLGSLHQLADGAEFSIIDADTKKEVAIGTAIKVSLVESLVQVGSPLEKSKLWSVNIKSIPVSPYKLLVGYDLEKLPKAWISLLDNTLKEFRFTGKSETPDCWISFVKDTGLVIITPGNDFAYIDGTAKNGVLDEAALKALKLPLQDIAKVNYMRNLPDGGNLAKQVTWEVKTKDGKKAGEHELNFKDGDLFDITFKNNSSKPIYYSIINIMPDGKMEVLLPFADEAAEDRSLQPGETFPIPDNEIEKGTPSGREYLRIMVSHTPFDVRPILHQQAKKRSGNLTSWEQAMGDIMQLDGNTAPRKRSVQVNEITLITQSFMVN